MRHGALKAKIADQRKLLGLHAAPLEAALSVADRGVEGLAWVKQHPAAVGGLVALLALLRPRRAWVWTKRGLVAWRGWQGLKNILQRVA